MKILIIGGTGNFGIKIIENLTLNKDIQLLACISRNPPSQAFSSVLYLQGDANNEGFLMYVMAENSFDCVVHIPNILLVDIQVLINVCKKTSVHQLIVIGSTGMFTKLDAPTREMRILKEKIIKESGINYTILRPNMVYGHVNDQNVYLLFKYINSRKFLFVPGSADVLQNPIHIDDFVHALIQSIMNPRAQNKAYNLVGKNPISLRGMVKVLDTEGKVIIITIPLWISLIGLKIFNVLGILNWKSEKFLRLNEEKLLVSTHAAVNDLNFNPRTFSEGIQTYWDRKFKDL
jgi:nucleoside-diphosphate-sugar epimerase